MPKSRQKALPSAKPPEIRDIVQGHANLAVNGERRRWPRQPTATEEESPASSPALQPLRFSTRDLASRNQFEAWQAYLAPLIDIKLPDGASEETGFPADHIAWNLGGMLIVQQQVPSHSYSRSLAKLRANSIDHWHVVLLRTGKSWTEVDGRVSEGGPGKLELRSLGHPFRGRTTDAQSLSLYLPREMFSGKIATQNIKANTVLLGTYTNLLIEYCENIEAKLPNLTATDLPLVVQTTRDMILTCLSSSTEHCGNAEPPANSALIERVRRFVQRNLNSTNLTPNTLCRELGISRTRLYQLLEPSGGVFHYIQKRRLLSAHAALSDSANRQRIVEIAAAVGFTSAAHFSRAFSKEFGYSPREARNVAVAPYVAHAVAPLETTDRALSFGDWLKSLGH
jgi:AraC-like DNA-binding protein